MLGSRCTDKLSQDLTRSVLTVWNYRQNQLAFLSRWSAGDAMEPKLVSASTLIVLPGLKMIMWPYCSYESGIKTSIQSVKAQKEIRHH